MLNIIGRKNIYFLISFLVIIPGIISLFLWGLKLSIDFTGGTRTTLLFPSTVNQQLIEKVNRSYQKENIDIVSLDDAEKRVTIKTKTLDEKENAKLLKQLTTTVGKVKLEEIETIGPTIGAETTLNAFKTMGIASLLIVLYIAYSFRTVPKPASSIRFGVCAVIALIHDALVVIGIFSLLGHYFNVEVDSLFVTAILTVVGFSVHDTIVVFDRIRENLRHNIGAPFDQVVNDSILQTMVRSLNTSLTAILVLFTLLIFGGASIKWFIFALLIGITSGTYSSIFNAAPLLVLWQEWDRKRKLKNNK
ncbi:MAG TPA: protein translocase subunit SecF [Candidatus Limnocylindrales bacterium]|nr:protein translocase subunit SecF [Candidatus Limnocylindrales bacterium]